jgi:hypothetical protein
MVTHQTVILARNETRLHFDVAHHSHLIKQTSFKDIFGLCVWKFETKGHQAYANAQLAIVHSETFSLISAPTSPPAQTLSESGMFFFWAAPSMPLTQDGLCGT